LTHHLDSSEIIYNKILNEYKSRTKWCQKYHIIIEWYLLVNV
jgi:hypothetical protein